MKVLITGDRNYTRQNTIDMILDGLYAMYGDDLMICHGGAKGADKMAQKWADKKWPGRTFKNVREYPAEWAEKGRAAGPIRNREMYDDFLPDVCFAFHDDLENSKGTLDMANYAKSKGTPVINIRKW